MLPWALLPSSPNGRHRAWRKRLRRWWPGDPMSIVSCGGLAPPFEGASPRKGVALRLGSRRLLVGDVLQRVAKLAGFGVLAFELDAQPQVVHRVGVAQCLVVGDEGGLEQAEQRLVEGLHA